MEIQNQLGTYTSYTSSAAGSVSPSTSQSNVAAPTSFAGSDTVTISPEAMELLKSEQNDPPVTPLNAGGTQPPPLKPPVQQ